MVSRHLALLLGLGAVAVVAACGSDSGSSSGGPDVNDGGGDSAWDGNPDVDVPDGPDVPPVAFPTSPPSLFGYELEEPFSGAFLSGAMDMAWPKGSTQPFVLQRGGYIVRLLGGTNREVSMCFSREVAFDAEAGALGMALHPKFNEGSPYVYVWFNRAAGAPNNPDTTSHQILRRWTWKPGGSQQPFDCNLEAQPIGPQGTTGTGVFADPVDIFDQKELDLEHNGAHIKFGPDGFLYFANGDDTRPDQTTQTLAGGLFSGIFRIDVDKDPVKSHAIRHVNPNLVTHDYFIPNDNPFQDPSGVNNEEYFALGFRNPYAFSFDKQTNEIYEGDVGDTFREEVNHIVKGHNYGWPIYEGTKRRRTGEPTIGTYSPPLYEYLHTSIGSLVADMAGFVYRGPSMPELNGKFIFSDWPTARIWALDTATGKRTSLVETNWSYPDGFGENPKYAPVGWAQDEAGELYMIAWSNIWRLKKSAAPHAVPLKLSQTNIFRNLKTLKTPTGVTRYEIKSPLWSDAAQKDRWVSIPAGSPPAQMDPDGIVVLPPGALLIKQFDLPDDAKPTNGRTHRLETRVMVQGTDTIFGFTYRWNAQGTDADLVTEAVEEQIGDENPDNARTWHFPSQAECWSCHRAENRILGFRGGQLNFIKTGAADTQLNDFINAGIFDGTASGSPPAMASPSDTSATIEERATAYLAANCSQCHHPGASYLGGGDTWDARYGVALADRHLVGKQNSNEPMAEFLGVPGGNLIQAGDPDHSILYQRLQTTDADVRMPPILRTKVDPIVADVIKQWIQSIQ